MSWILVRFVKICNFRFFEYFLSFSEFNDHYWPTKTFQVSEMGYLIGLLETKNGSDFFIAEFKTFCLILPFSILFYMIYLLTVLEN